MRTPVIAVSLTLLPLIALPAHAATTIGGGDAATALPLGPPKVFEMAGYTQPDITPGLCKVVSTSQTQCVIPEMTAGRYYIEAAGTSKATDAGAAQQLTILVGDRQCTSLQRGSGDKDPWAVGAPRTFKVGCYAVVLTDRPLLVNAVYLDGKATKDAKGPLLSIRRESWAGIVNATGVLPPQAGAPQQ